MCVAKTMHAWRPIISMAKEITRKKNMSMWLKYAVSCNKTSR